MKLECEVTGCHGPAFRAGRCRLHYELPNHGPIILPKDRCLIWNCGKRLDLGTRATTLRGSNGMCWEHYLEVAAEDIPDSHRCTAPECRTVIRDAQGRQVYGMRGLCWPHYDQARGTLEPWKRPAKPLCACGKPSLWKGQCRNCYERDRRQDPATRQAVLARGRRAHKRFHAKKKLALAA